MKKKVILRKCTDRRILWNDEMPHRCLYHSLKHDLSQRLVAYVLIFLALTWLSACATASTPQIVTQVVEKEIVKTVEVQEPAAEVETPAETATSAGAPQPTIPQIRVTATPGSAPIPTAPPAGEAQFAEKESRLVELEWPARMRLGDSDVIRLSLIPTEDGYTVKTEFPDHTTDTQDVVVLRPAGYRVQAAARLEGVGFEFSPQGEQAMDIPVGQPLTWYWSLQPERAGQQRLAVRLSLHWEPLDSQQGGRRETLLYNRALNVQVSSFFGLNRSQALTGGLFGLFLGAGMVLFGVVYQPAGLRSVLRIAEPNPALAIELPPGLSLSGQESTLLRTLFRRYGRLVLESEFLSGYSGARTFLARPLHPPVRPKGLEQPGQQARVGLGQQRLA